MSSSFLLAGAAVDIFDDNGLWSNKGKPETGRSSNSNSGTKVRGWSFMAVLFHTRSRLLIVSCMMLRVEVVLDELCMGV